MKEKKKKNKFKHILTYFITFFICVIVSCAGIFAYYEIKYPVKYKDSIIKYSNEYVLEKELVASIINEESSFNPNAVSSKGAIGLMQISPKTGAFIANELGESFSRDKLLNPEINIKYGCFYLNYLRKRFPIVSVYLSAYNAGETTVKLWLNNKELSKDGVSLDKIPYKATQQYTEKILFGKKHYLKRL